MAQKLEIIIYSVVEEMHYINYIMIFAYIHRLDFTIEDNEFLPVAGLGNNGQAGGIMCLPI